MRARQRCRARRCTLRARDAMLCSLGRSATAASAGSTHPDGFSQISIGSSKVELSNRAYASTLRLQRTEGGSCDAAARARQQRHSGDKAHAAVHALQHATSRRPEATACGSQAACSQQQQHHHPAPHSLTMQATGCRTARPPAHCGWRAAPAPLSAGNACSCTGSQQEKSQGLSRRHTWHAAQQRHAAAVAAGLLRAAKIHCFGQQTMHCFRQHTMQEGAAASGAAPAAGRGHLSDRKVWR